MGFLHSRELQKIPSISLTFPAHLLAQNRSILYNHSLLHILCSLISLLGNSIYHMLMPSFVSVDILICFYRSLRYYNLELCVGSFIPLLALLILVYIPFFHAGFFLFTASCTWSFHLHVSLSPSFLPIVIPSTSFAVSLIIFATTPHHKFLSSFQFTFERSPT